VTDRNRDRSRDGDKNYKQTRWPSKHLNHATELNKQILKSSDTIELWRGRVGPDRQIDSGKDRNKGTGRESDRYKKKDGSGDNHCGRDRDDDRSRERGSDKDRQYAITQRPSKQFNIELNKQIIKISETRKLCDFISAHAAEFYHVNENFLSEIASGFTLGSS
jgi:hypothetical protein